MTKNLPAYPLLLIDPYFSIWSKNEILNKEETYFWTGSKKTAYGYVQVNGKTFRFLGGEGGEALEQTARELTAFESIYTFECAFFSLKVWFISPRNPEDPYMLSMPACMIRYELTEKKSCKNVSVVFGLHENCCYQNANMVKGGVVKGIGYHAAFVGLERQLVLSNSQDAFSADWGYVYVAGDAAIYHSQSALNDFFEGKSLTYSCNKDEIKYISAISHKLDGNFAVAMDDVVSIYYFGSPLKSMYLKRHTVFDALERAIHHVRNIQSECQFFDSRLAEKAGGKNEHYELLVAALRQSVAAHKLVQDDKGRLLFLSKECHSNGCIATVDVSYPSTPLYLMYNPELVWGMLYPIFDFAKMPCWEYDFAPHDVGTYPLCTGQTYGLNNRDDAFACDNLFIVDHENQKTHLHFYAYPKGNDIYDLRSQMPVEECSNMIIMTDLAHKLSPKVIEEKDFDLLIKWANYLEQFGLIPSNQLCTDDFAGHLDKNANLSVKAIVALGAMAELCKRCKRDEMAKRYRETAERYAKEWTHICYKDRKFSPLTMNGEGAYSLKYNLLFDKVLKLNLFGEEVYEKEVDACIEHLNPYGCPLDERKTYTKSDWLMWICALTENKKKQNKIIHSLISYLENSETRCPFSDWYDTVSAKSVGFCNRTVQGGIFALLLKESKLF